MGNAFDRLYERGAAALLRGAVEAQEPPRVHGPRWGTSVVLRPDSAAAGRIETLALRALSVAGREHWPTGARVSSHLTVRAVEPYRGVFHADDAALTRYAAAMECAAAACAGIRFALTGVTLTPNSVMLSAEPHDDAAGAFAAALVGALGDDAWFEAGFRRDIWYLTLLHFTGPVDTPQRLVDWVGERRALDVGETEVGAAELISWRFTGDRVVPVTLATAPFARSC